MTAARRPRTETQAETRRHLLDAAQRLFADHGLQQTTVAEIARTAGYTTGAIYANFERKEHLAVAVLERNIGRTEHALAEALAVDGDVASRLLAVIRWRRAQLVDQDPFEVLRLELWLLALRDSALREALVAWQRRLQLTFAALLDRQAADLGVAYSVDTELLAGALLTAADGTSIAHALDPGARHQDAYTWAMASLMVNAIDPCPVGPLGWPAFIEALMSPDTDGPDTDDPAPSGSAELDQPPSTS